MISKIHFTVRNKRKHCWTVDHNLHKYGLSIDAAFINWSARTATDELDSDLFEEYVVDKDPTNLKCKVINRTP